MRPPTNRPDAAVPEAAAPATRRARGQVQTYGPDRTCAEPGCDATLSRYNPNEVCWPHGEGRDARPFRQPPSAADEVEIYDTDGGTWVDGYEVCGLASLDGHAAFQVRRQADGVVSPDAVPATRIRPAHSAPSLRPSDWAG